MLIGRLLWNNDRKNQVNRLIVGRFEVNRLFEFDKHADSPVKVGQPGMRHRESPAEAGTAQSLAIEQITVKRGLRQMQLTGCAVGDKFEQFLLTGDFGINENTVGGQESGDCH